MDDLEALFREHNRALYAYFLRMVPDPRDAEDLTQETFVRACAAALRFRGESTLRTWLFGIARKVLLEFYRRRRWEPIPDEVPESVPPDPTDSVFLARALSRLQDGDREVLVLVDVLGFSPRELADMIDVSHEAARVRLHRARRRLRQVVQGYAEGGRTDG